ncbi:MAG: aminopeptidase N [Actinobacteria bacterium]|nr:aminopeptidase N [Actinomycetota bacterium]MBI3688780.1 aminopeptidase N [Actinomycetota bacterium]
MSVPNLTREQASRRAALLHVLSYDVALDLTDGIGGPGDRTFRSRTVVRFDCRHPGESTFIDLIADRIHRAELNGVPVDLSGYTTAGGIVLRSPAARNELVVDADLLYMNTGEGLHRFVDPVDKRVYLYSQFETADAKRMYACFDQPDLKATLTLTVTAPADWEVVSNGPVIGVEERPEGGKVVRCATTPRISTYITALVAGPYHRVDDHHDGIDLGVFCRRSLAEHLDADEIFTVTKQGFDWYHANFGYRYPFGKYDQLFVPEFNAGAMENAGCVTILEDYVFRSKTTDYAYERRAETLLHEMAHMWFGDLVTMRWWDDLWLNESFATFISVLCQSGATRWRQAWTTFVNVEKTWAYRQDQLPSTHPISCDIPDMQAVEVNFDGITYAKGASVLKQLAAYVGTEEFLAGLRTYFRRHEYGNTTLADLLRALEESSGRDLSGWSGQWLETAGLNTIRPELTVDARGRIDSFAVVQTAPREVADSNVLRSHRLAIGLYAGTPLARVHRVELDVSGARTEVPELIGQPRPDLVLVNDDDLTYCKMRLDEASLACVRDRIGELTESLPRALCWAAAWDMTRDGEMAARDYLQLVLSGIGAETDIGAVQTLHRQVGAALHRFADPEWAPAGWRSWADAALAALRGAEPGSDHQLAWARAFAAAARSPEHLPVLRGVLDGTKLIAGLSVDTDLRWSLLHGLVAAGGAGEQEIDAELVRDNTATGLRRAATARALRPDPAAKEAAWREATENDELPNAINDAIILGFAHPAHAELQRPYLDRYFAMVPEVWKRRTSESAQRVVVGLFPGLVEQSVLAAADAFLAGPDVPAALRRLILEGRADVVRALAARARDRAGAGGPTGPAG